MVFITSLFSCFLERKLSIKCMLKFPHLLSKFMLQANCEYKLSFYSVYVVHWANKISFFFLFQLMLRRWRPLRCHKFKIILIHLSQLNSELYVLWDHKYMYWARMKGSIRNSCIKLKSKCLDFHNFLLYIFMLLFFVIKH